MTRKAIELTQDDEGTFSLENLEGDFNPDLPEIPMIDVAEIQRQLEKQVGEITEAQIKALKTARAIQLAGVQVKALSEVVNMHLQIKGNESSFNRNFLRISVTPSGVYSEQVTPFLKQVEHVIDLSWD